MELAWGGILARGLEGFDTGITDLVMTRGADGPRLLAFGAGGISSYTVAATGRAVLTDQARLAAGTTAFAEGEAVVLAHGAGPAWLVTAPDRDIGVQTLGLEAAATLAGNAARAAMTGSRPVAPQALAADGDRLYIADRAGVISGWEVTATGALARTGAASPERDGISALSAFGHGGRDWLAAATATGDSLSLYVRLDSGAILRRDTLGAEDGLGISGITALETARVAGQTFLLAAAANSGAIAVVRVGTNGTLAPTDLVIDDRDSRFAGVQSLAVVERAGQTFVVAAGGADDGISLFLLLPGGRLLHLAAYADTTEAPLDGVRSVAAAATDTGLAIFAAAAGEPGIARLTVDLSSMGEVLTGTTDDDRLTGTGADDILVAGTGRDRLTGGLGADTFVLTAEASRATIADYRALHDRIDLSMIPLLHSADQLSIASASWGATIRFQTWEWEVQRLGGGRLTADNIDFVFGPTHLPTGTVPPSQQISGYVRIGTEGADRLSGGNGNDLLRGLEGNDLFYASPGRDTIDGGPGRDTVSFERIQGRVLVDQLYDVQEAGFVRFFQAGHVWGDSYLSIERFVGGAFADNLRGADGDDILEGGGVSDRLYGRAGDDTLLGGTGADALYGNRGADVMTGGPDADRRDRYIYFHPEESLPGSGNRDLITDFVPGEDRIEISRFDADLTRPGRQEFTLIGNRAFSGEAGELRAAPVWGRNHSLVQADLDGDGRADFEIELTGRLTLTLDDFYL